MALLFMASEAVKVTKGRLSIYPSSPSQPAFLRRVRLAGVLRAARALIAAIALGSLDKPCDFKPTMHVCTECAME